MDCLACQVMWLAGPVCGNLLYQANRGNRVAVQKTVASAAAFFPAVRLCTDDLRAAAEAGKGILEYYRLSASSGMGGGLFGGLLFGGIRSFIGSIGAFLVMAVGLIICMVCITQRSFVKAVKRHSDGPTSMPERIWSAVAKFMRSVRKNGAGCGRTAGARRELKLYEAAVR